MDYRSILLARAIGGGGGITPTGSLSITENDTYDVTSYAEAVVNVPTSGTDVSDTTAAAGDVKSGKYFYTSSGVKTEGSLVPLDVSDTTAVASDVASGKYFYLANGTKTVGTASGGGGASNFVKGTFTTGATRNTVGTVSIPYTGSGYPIAFMVYIKNGAYNNSDSGNTEWYNSLNRYDAGWIAGVKSQISTTPTWSDSSNTGPANGFTVAIISKNSTTNSTSYTRASSMSTLVTVKDMNPNGSGGGYSAIMFRNDPKVMSYYIGNLAAAYVGFPPSTEMEYIVVYSS